MRLTWINGAFPRGRRAPRRSSGLGATADRALRAARDLQEASRGRGERAEVKEEEDDDDDDDGDAPPRLAWHSQKAAPLVVRVIDDRENMRARKKKARLLDRLALIRGILSRRRDARAPRKCQAGCSGIVAAVFRNARYCQKSDKPSIIL